MSDSNPKLASEDDRYSIMRDVTSHKLFNSAEEGWQFALSQAKQVSQKTGVGMALYLQLIEHSH